MNTLASILGGWFSADGLATDSDVRSAMQSISTSQMQAWNVTVVNAKGVYYQSFAGFSRQNGTSTPTHDAKVAAACKPTSAADGNGLSLFRAEDYLALPLVPLYTTAGGGSTDVDQAEPNDGLVPITSASWGNFRGCIPADHIEQLGQYDIPDTNVRTGVDISVFYASITADLAARGF